MQTNSFSSRRWVYLITIYIFGSSAIIGSASQMKQDAWIAILMSLIYIIPLILVCARIMTLYPNKNLYEIVFALFGKVVGSVISVLFIWYCLHLGALVLNNYVTFLFIVQIPDTPQLAIALVMIPAIIYVAKKGLRCLGKWSAVILVLTSIVLVSTTLIAAKSLKFEHLFPIMEHSVPELLGSAYEIFTFPFAEIVVLLAAAPTMSANDKPGKIFLIAILLSMAIFLLQTFRNITVGGAENLVSQLYSSYFAVKLIKLTEVLSRFESLIPLTLKLCGIGKIAVCLIAASKGFTKLIRVDSYKTLIVPCGMLMYMVSALLFQNTQQQFDFLNIYKIYAIPFQIVIPLVVWIAAEIKKPKKKPKAKNQTATNG